MAKKKLKMGMIGGGITGFIGAVHLRAAIMESKVELVCGSFSSNPETSKKSGEAYSVPETEYTRPIMKCLKRKWNCRKMKEWILFLL